MSTLFDDVARIIASPISRRKALRMVGGAVGSAAFAALGLETASWALTAASASVSCKKGQTACGSSCCSSTQICCGND